MIRVLAPAKVNLRLRVLARQESGYHSLETLFCAISLSDEVIVARAADGVSLEVDGAPPTAAPEQNLVVRAARAYLHAAGLTGGLSLRLTKRIPVEGGLGGGSSDAAATLRALDALRASEAGASTAPDLLTLGADLGSDVPFFLCGSPFALGWGRGENLLALPPLPARPVLIAHPGRGVSTPAAFRHLAATRGPSYRAAPAAIPLERLRDWDAVAGIAVNEFEPPATEEIPVLGTAIEAIRESGALVAMLAGSGACVFGVFPSESSRDAAGSLVADLGLRIWHATTLEAMPEPAPAPAAPRTAPG